MTLHIGLSLDGAGQHPAAWREPDAAAADLFGADRLVALAREAERGLLDFVTLGDSFDLQRDGQDHVRGRLDALLALARVAPATTSIGLVPTVTTTHTEPFHISKNIATLDFVSLGRAGWMVDISTTEAEARHFGRRSPAPLDDLYAEAAEAIDVVGQLWDSWEDDAVIRDVPTGRYIDRDRVHYTNFEGRFFSVRGPSITPRSPQGQSLVMVEARDDHGLALGIAHADVVVVHVADLDAAVAVRRRVRAESDAMMLASIDVLLGETTAEARATRARLDAVAPASPVALDFVGTAAEFVDVAAAWSDAGAVDGFLVRPALSPRTVTQFVDTVVPALQRRGLFRTDYESQTLRGLSGLGRPANQFASA